MKQTIFCLAALASSTAAVAADKSQERLEALIARAPAEIEPLIAVKGDNLDPSIEVSTYGATQFVSKGLIASTTTENSFLRGFINRKTGVITAQIYHRASYGGRSWKFFNHATYETPDGIEDVEVSRVGNDVHCARYGCSYDEDIVIPVKFEVLQKAAKMFDPANPKTGIHYRIFSQAGTNIDEGIPGNEITAFVRVIEREVAKRPAP